MFDHWLVICTFVVTVNKRFSLSLSLSLSSEWTKSCQIKLVFITIYLAGVLPVIQIDTLCCYCSLHCQVHFEKCYPTLLYRPILSDFDKCTTLFRYFSLLGYLELRSRWTFRSQGWFIGRSGDWATCYFTHCSVSVSATTLKAMQARGPAKVFKLQVLRVNCLS